MKALLIFIFVCFQGMAYSQIMGGEYFWNEDPGPGNGTAVDVEAQDETIIGFEVDPTGLEPGIHRLSYRSSDENGHWSHVEQTWVIIDGISVFAIVAAEYWWDSDPGEGNGTSLTLTSGDEVDGTFTIDAEGLTPGRHLCGIRVQDESGIWSHHEKTYVIIDDPMIHDLVQAEYFWNTDPGTGNGIPVLIDQDENWLEQIDIDNTGLDLGDHWLHVRVKDEQGHWSHYDRDLITICTSWPAVSNWDTSIDGLEWTCSDMSENADSLSWTIDGLEQSTESDFNFEPDGPTEVCLTAYSSCGDSTLCAMVGLPVLLEVDPASVPNNAGQTVDLIGYALDSLSMVHIERGIESITASNVIYQNSGLLTAEFDFDMETAGLWDVIVILENNDELVLPEGLELTESVDVLEMTANDMMIFPNPANNRLNLVQECHGPCEILLDIIDCTGKSVFSQSSVDDTIILDTSSWSEGVYIVRTVQNSQVINRKVLIQH